MESIIEDTIHARGFALRVEGLRKGLFYSLCADRIVISRLEKEFILLNSVDADINPFGLIVKRMPVTFRGRIGGGTFTGSAPLSMEFGTVQLVFNQASLDEMRFLTEAGIRGRGSVSGNMALTEQGGNIEFIVNDAEIEPAFISGTLLPLNFFKTVKGSLVAEGKTINVQSLSLEGPDIFARVKGVIRDGNMDLLIELMPQKTLLENPLFLSQVERYQVSPGYYVVPVKGPIAL